MSASYTRYKLKGSRELKEKSGIGSGSLVSHKRLKRMLTYTTYAYAESYVLRSIKEKSANT
jgi:hypothetical protein